jgi:hypothetical protein
VQSETKEKIIQSAGIVLTLFYGGFVFWLYLVSPTSLQDLSSKAQQTIEKATTKTQVLTGIYQIDEAKFQEGLEAFRKDNFVLARDYFEKADPEKLSAKVQFYVAYSFYRQGWGRFYNDDELFKKGLESVELVMKLDRDFRADDPDLKLKTPVELKQELEEGLRVTPEDFSPIKIFRERK